MALKVPDCVDHYCGKGISDPKRRQLGTALDLAAFHQDIGAVQVLFEYALKTQEHSQKSLIKWSNLVYFTRQNVLGTVDEEAAQRRFFVLPLLDAHMQSIAERINVLCHEKGEPRIPLTIKDYAKRYIGRELAMNYIRNQNYMGLLETLLDEAIDKEDKEAVQLICDAGIAWAKHSRSLLSDWSTAVRDSRNRVDRKKLGVSRAEFPIEHLSLIKCGVDIPGTTRTREDILAMASVVDHFRNKEIEELLDQHVKSIRNFMELVPDSLDRQPYSWAKKKLRFPWGEE